MRSIAGRLLLTIMILMNGTPVWASAGSDYLVEAGKQARKNGRLDEASYYFKLARDLDPSIEDYSAYVSGTGDDDDRTVSGDDRDGGSGKPLQLALNPRSSVHAEEIPLVRDRVKPAPAPAPVVSPASPVQSAAVHSHDKAIRPKASEAEVLVDLRKYGPEDFPLTVELLPEETLQVRAEALKRFLAVDPSIAGATRIDGNTLQVGALAVGETFVHVWDPSGRRTFHIKVIPHRIAPLVERYWEEADGLRVRYNAGWSSLHRGRRIDETDRRSLAFSQSLSVSGPTPIGTAGADVSWTRKSNGTLRTTREQVYVRDGHFLNFDDFSAKAIDINASLSAFSLGGASLKGFEFESPAFNDAISYRVIHGRERGTYYGALTESIKKDSYVEGFQLSILPRTDHRWYLNYAQGYGDHRSADAADHVYSVVTEQRWDAFNMSAEVAHDEDRFAAIMYSTFLMPRSSVRLSLRNVESGFSTVMGGGAYGGEIGGRLGYSFRPTERSAYYTSVDVYRDRENFNPEHPDRPNLTWDGTAEYKLSEDMRLAQTVYYVNSMGQPSPNRSYTATTRLMQQVPLSLLNDRSLSLHYAYTYQRSISSGSSLSNFQRDTVSAGVRVPLSRWLGYSLNYQYSWVDELGTGESSNPTVMDTGLDYFLMINPRLTAVMHAYYRDEEDNETLHSFLAGEDSLDTGLNVTYAPNDDVEFYFDGSTRTVWAESAGTEKYTEIQLRLGTSIDWESFVCWAPAATISGCVFNDRNANGVHDEGEPGVPGVRILAGPREATSDEDGRYRVRLRARKATARLDLGTLAGGYVLSTPAAVELETADGKPQTLDFGIAAHSGIRGVVFYDINHNDQYDPADTLVSRVKLVLNGKSASVTNSSGAYIFSDIEPGVHTLALDLNSLDMQYMPKVPVKKEIEIIEGLFYTYNVPLTKKE